MTVGGTSTRIWGAGKTGSPTARPRPLSPPHPTTPFNPVPQISFSKFSSFRLTDHSRVPGGPPFPGLFHSKGTARRPHIPEKAPVSLTPVPIKTFVLLRCTSLRNTYPTFTGRRLFRISFFLLIPLLVVTMNASGTLFLFCVFLPQFRPIFPFQFISSLLVLSCSCFLLRSFSPDLMEDLLLLSVNRFSVPVSSWLSSPFFPVLISPAYWVFSWGFLFCRFTSFLSGPFWAFFAGSALLVASAV